MGGWRLLAAAAPSAAGTTAFAAKPEFARHRRTLFRIAGCGKRMIARQLPAPQIIHNPQAVPGPEMAAQRLAAKTAFKTYDVIVMNRPPDRNRGRQRGRRLHRGTQTSEGAVDRGDQRRQLIG